MHISVARDVINSYRVVILTSPYDQQFFRADFFYTYEIQSRETRTKFVEKMSFEFKTENITNLETEADDSASIVLQLESEDEVDKKREKKPIKKSRVKRHRLNFKKYLVQILKGDMHPGLSIQKKSLIVVDQIMKHMFRKIIAEAKKLLLMSNKKVLTVHVMKSATKFVLSKTPNLRRIALEVGQKAVEKYY